jgi:hypothetical protein
VVVGAVVIITAGLLPGPWHHHEGDYQDCSICKAGNQPALLNPATLTVAPPTPHASSVPRQPDQHEVVTEYFQSSPRAPPA